MWFVLVASWLLMMTLSFVPQLEAGRPKHSMISRFSFSILFIHVIFIISREVRISNCSFLVC